MWIDEGEVRREAAGAARRGGARRGGAVGAKGRDGRSSAAKGRAPKGRRGPRAVGRSASTANAASLTAAVGSTRGPRLARRLDEAGDAFAQERYQDAVKILRPIAREAPSVPEVRELLGLALYRLGRWRAAIEELEAFRAQTGSTEEHPVLADCYRAEHRWNEVHDLWEELRDVSPSAPLVSEGRIVAAGALADQDRVPEALALLRSGWRLPSRPQEHHLRRAYALADLEERAGDLPRARELFGWVASVDPDLADVVERVAALD